MHGKGLSPVLVLAAALATLTLAISPASARATLITCHGLVPTISVVSDGAVYGTGGPDVIVVTGSATVYGFGGDDHICMDGFGVVHAGSGNDQVSTSDGGGDCPFAIYGGSGADNLRCANEIYGESGDDRLSFAGLLSGGAGNDFLDLGLALCDGGSGNDTATNCFGEVRSIEHLL